MAISSSRHLCAQSQEDLESQNEKLTQRVEELETKVTEVGNSTSKTNNSNSIRLSDIPQSEEEKQLTTLYDDGFYLIGKDDTLKIGGWAQIDYRDFIGKHPSKDTFLIRRARLDLRGILENDFSYRLYAAFGGGSARLHEAWVEYQKFPFARLRIGQFKEPFSLEEIYSARWIYFLERSIVVTNLAPFEDIGIQLFGDVFRNRIIYAIAVFNGQGKNVLDIDNGKDIAARVTYQPFRDYPESHFDRLYLGASFTAGSIDSSVGNIRYRTAARTTFLTFTSTDFEDGPHYRGGLEIQWLNGPLVFNGEYIVSHRHRVGNDSSRATVSSKGWYLSASYLLTGEKQPRNNPVKPKHNFNPCKGDWGAWEIGARYEQFRTNSASFELGLVNGIRFVSVATAGITWWPNKHIKCVGNFVYTDFHKNLIVKGISLHHEINLLFRAQYNF